MNGTKSGRLRVLPFFSAISFVVILVAGVLLLLLYRTVAISTISDIGEVNNLAIIDTSMGGWETEVVRYLELSDRAASEPVVDLSASPGLRDAIEQLLAKTGVVRVKLYNRQGRVVYSTKAEQIGNDQHDNPGFISAVGGATTSKLIYRDTYNQFDQSTDEDNLLQSYVPVPWSRGQTPVGVIEIYTNVHPLSHLIERNEGMILLGVALVSLGLYSVLVLTVRRVSMVIEHQQSLLHERTRTLEVLSSRLLDAEEGEKKRLAAELQEGVMQSLGACKAQLEYAERVVDQQDQSGQQSEVLKPAVSSLREVMAEVRSLALDLRPSSLDDFGLLPTTRDFVSEISHGAYANLTVDFVAELDEREVPHMLKAILYRIIKDAVHSIAHHAQASSVEIRISRHGSNVCLEIGDDGVPVDVQRSVILHSPMRARGIEVIRERTVLSGGEFELDRSSLGGSAVRCHWPV